MAMRFSDQHEETEKCEACGYQGNSAPLAYQVVETKHLCTGCAEKRASKILLRDPPCQDSTPIGKTLSLKCKHCTVGICSKCEIVIQKELERLSLRDATPPTDIKDKLSFRLSKEIELPRHIKYPCLCCITEDSKVVIVDKDSGSLYLTDLDSGEVERIVTNGPTMVVSDCTTANGDELALSNFASGCLVLFDMSGKALSNIPLPDQKAMKDIFICSDAEGHILVVRRGESGIFVVNSHTKQNIRKVSLGDKRISRGIQAASSNKIIVGSEWAEFIVLDVSGHQTTVSDRNWFQAECSVHPTQDLLYVLYSRNGADPQTVHLDEVTMLGEIKRRNILSFRMHGPLSRPFITSRMELVVCSGRNILIFE